MHKLQVVHLVIGLHQILSLMHHFELCDSCLDQNILRTGRLLMIDFIFLNAVCCCESQVHITSHLHNLLSGSVNSDNIGSNLFK